MLHEPYVSVSYAKWKSTFWRSYSAFEHANVWLVETQQSISLCTFTCFLPIYYPFFLFSFGYYFFFLISMLTFWFCWLIVYPGVWLFSSNNFSVRPSVCLSFCSSVLSVLLSHLLILMSVSKAVSGVHLWRRVSGGLWGYLWL